MRSGGHHRQGTGPDHRYSDKFTEPGTGHRSFRNQDSSGVSIGSERNGKLSGSGEGDFLIDQWDEKNIPFKKMISKVFRS